MSWCREHIADSNAGLQISAETLGSRNISLGCFVPTPFLSLAHLDVTFLNSPATTSLIHPGCTVYNWKRANRRILFLGGICRTWDVCIYKYIIYINIYNTDLKKIKFPWHTFFLICAKNVFSEKILFSYSDFVLSLICISALRYSTGPAPMIWECHSHSHTDTHTDCTKKTGFPLPVTLTSPLNFLTLINLWNCFSQRSFVLCVHWITNFIKKYKTCQVWMWLSLGWQDQMSLAYEE